MQLRDARPGSTAIALPSKAGTVAVTVRLERSFYERLKRTVLDLSVTAQSLLYSALGEKLDTLSRQKKAPVAGQTGLFGEAQEPTKAQPLRQEKFGFLYPEPVIALTYRASVPMHRWLHAESDRTGRTIQDLITDALKISGAP